METGTGVSPKIKKFVIVLCGLDDKGRVIPARRPPYGYHHIVKVYEDVEEGFPEVLVSGLVSEEDTMAIAKIIAKGIPVEVNERFYPEHKG